VAACAIGVVVCEAAICVWHFAHSAVPTNLSRDVGDLVGHQPGDEMWSSVASETFVADELDEERACATRCAQQNAAANRQAVRGTRARSRTSDTYEGRKDFRGGYATLLNFCNVGEYFWLVSVAMKMRI